MDGVPWVSIAVFLDWNDYWALSGTCKFINSALKSKKSLFQMLDADDSLEALQFEMKRNNVNFDLFPCLIHVHKRRRAYRHDSMKISERPVGVFLYPPSWTHIYIGNTGFGSDCMCTTRIISFLRHFNVQIKDFSCHGSLHMQLLNLPSISIQPDLEHNGYCVSCGEVYPCSFMQVSMDSSNSTLLNALESCQPPKTGSDILLVDPTPAGLMLTAAMAGPFSKVKVAFSSYYPWAVDEPPLCSPPVVPIANPSENLCRRWSPHTLVPEAILPVNDSPAHNLPERPNLISARFFNFTANLGVPTANGEQSGSAQQKITSNSSCPHATSNVSMTASESPTAPTVASNFPRLPLIERIKRQVFGKESNGSKLRRDASGDLHDDEQESKHPPVDRSFPTTAHLLAWIATWFGNVSITWPAKDPCMISPVHDCMHASSKNNNHCIKNTEYISYMEGLREKTKKSFPMGPLTRFADSLAASNLIRSLSCCNAVLNMYEPKAALLKRLRVQIPDTSLSTLDSNAEPISHSVLVAIPDSSQGHQSFLSLSQSVPDSLKDIPGLLNGDMDISRLCWRTTTREHEAGDPLPPSVRTLIRDVEGRGGSRPHAALRVISSNHAAHAFARNISSVEIPSSQSQGELTNCFGPILRKSDVQHLASSNGYCNNSNKAELKWKFSMVVFDIPNTMRYAPYKHEDESINGASNSSDLWERRKLSFHVIRTVSLLEALIDMNLLRSGWTLHVPTPLTAFRKVFLILQQKNLLPIRSEFTCRSATPVMQGDGTTPQWNSLVVEHGHLALDDLKSFKDEEMFELGSLSSLSPLVLLSIAASSEGAAKEKVPSPRSNGAFSVARRHGLGDRVYFPVVRATPAPTNFPCEPSGDLTEFSSSHEKSMDDPSFEVPSKNLGPQYKLHQKKKTKNDSSDEVSENLKSSSSAALTGTHSSSSSSSSDDEDSEDTRFGFRGLIDASPSTALEMSRAAAQALIFVQNKIKGSKINTDFIHSSRDHLRSWFTSSQETCPLEGSLNCRQDSISDAQKTAKKMHQTPETRLAMMRGFLGRKRLSYEGNVRTDGSSALMNLLTTSALGDVRRRFAHFVNRGSVVNQMESKADGDALKIVSTSKFLREHFGSAVNTCGDISDWTASDTDASSLDDEQKLLSNCDWSRSMKEDSAVKNMENSDDDGILVHDFEDEFQVDNTSWSQDDDDYDEWEDEDSE